MAAPEPLKLVPFNPVWVQHEKIDIHAIYRRPRSVQDEFGEWHREYKNGLPTWDITGPLPLKQHTVWTGKGFEYVTLANRESLMVAAKHGTVMEPDPDHPGQLRQCMNWKVYDQHQISGPWSWRKYSQGNSILTTQAEEQLVRDVELFGSLAVETIRRQTDPAFSLPEHMQGIPPGGKVNKGGPGQAPPPTSRDADTEPVPVGGNGKRGGR